VLRDLTLRIDDDDRIALLGSNGNGKSTLAKLLAGRLAPMSGSITRAEKLTVAYFAQHQLDELVEGDSAYEHVRRRMPDAPEAKVRARVATIGFSGGMADTKVGSLSGGEKARLLLGLATLHGPHLVILDEPTNHLDIDSRAALIEALNEYPGAVILISHDRYLIEACADRLWEVANGTVTPLDDDIDAYRRRILSTRRGDNGKASAKREAEPRGSKTDARRAAADKRVELTPLRTRVKTAEDAIKRLTRELASLDAQLGDPNLHRDAGKLAQLGKARATTAAGLARAEADWLAASSEYEAARSEGT
jgi:ATP-binding cassette, subfamily F, member 3